MEDIYIPGIGDTLRAIKWSYKLGSWIGNNLAADDVLSQMAKCLKEAIDSKSNNETLKIINHFDFISKQYSGNQKCQDALFHCLNSKAFILKALCLWSKHNDNLDELAKVGIFFDKAIESSLFVLAIKTTVLSANSADIRNFQSMAKSDLTNINNYCEQWRSYYHQLYYNSPTKWIDFKGFIRDNVNGCMYIYVFKRLINKLENSIWKL